MVIVPVERIVLPKGGPGVQIPINEGIKKDMGIGPEERSEGDSPEIGFCFPPEPPLDLDK